MKPGRISVILLVLVLAAASHTHAPAHAQAHAQAPGQSASGSKDVYQVHYSDTPLSPKELKELEKIYGCKLVVLSTKDAPPKKPLLVKGTVVHSDLIEDPAFVLGTKNPALDGKAINAALADRWLGEATLLKTSAPEFYPETELGTKYLTNSQALELDAKIQRLEEVRAQVQADLGKSILKSRTGFGSAGILPTTNNDWADLYRNYVTHTKPLIQELEKKITDPDLLQDAILEAEPKFLEGRVLDQLLEQPDSILIQKMYPLDKEVRVHVIEGKVLKQATVNRFEYLGKYVTEQELTSVEKAVQKFLNKLPAEKKKLSATMDVILSGERFLIVDLNSGIESGMYYPENDLFISNLLSERFSGKPTPYLKDFRAFEQAPLNKKLDKLKSLTREYGEWVAETETSGFWDRISSAYVREIEKHPTASTYEAVLKQLKEGGLRDSWIYHALIAEVDDRFPSVKLSKPKLEQWNKFLNRIAEDVEYTYLEDGQIQVIPETDYSDGQAMRRAATLLREQENPKRLAKMSVHEAEEYLRKGTLKNFYTPDRLKTEAPLVPWAESISDLSKDRAIFYEDGSYFNFTKKALKRAGILKSTSSRKFKRTPRRAASAGCVSAALKGLL